MTTGNSSGPHLHFDVRSSDEEVEPGYKRVKVVDPVTGVGKIAIERQRQVIDKGYTLEHDQEHSTTDLMSASDAYSVYARWLLTGHTEDSARDLGLSFWPWDSDGFNPESIDDALVKAGALIAAAIDRESGTEYAVKPK